MASALENAIHALESAGPVDTTAAFAKLMRDLYYAASKECDKIAYVLWLEKDGGLAHDVRWSTSPSIHTVLPSSVTRTFLDKGYNCIGWGKWWRPDFWAIPSPQFVKRAISHSYHEICKPLDKLCLSNWSNFAWMQGRVDDLIRYGGEDFLVFWNGLFPPDDLFPASMTPEEYRRRFLAAWESYAKTLLSRSKAILPMRNGGALGLVPNLVEDSIYRHLAWKKSHHVTCLAPVLAEKSHLPSAAISLVMGYISEFVPILKEKIPQGRYRNVRSEAAKKAVATRKRKREETSGL